jgi:hypothetical protein
MGKSSGIYRSQEKSKWNDWLKCWPPIGLGLVVCNEECQKEMATDFTQSVSIFVLNVCWILLFWWFLWWCRDGICWYFLWRLSCQIQYHVWSLLVTQSGVPDVFRNSCGAQEQEQEQGIHNSWHKMLACTRSPGLVERYVFFKLITSLQEFLNTSGTLDWSTNSHH